MGKLRGFSPDAVWGDCGAVVPGPSQGASRFIQMLCVVLTNRRFLGSGVEPILIRAGETRRSEGHHDTEQFLWISATSGIEKKKNSEGSPVSYLEAEAYFFDK